MNQVATEPNLQIDLEAMGVELTEWQSFLLWTYVNAWKQFAEWEEYGYELPRNLEIWKKFLGVDLKPEMEIAHLRQVVKSAMKITMKQMAEKSGRTIEEIAEAVFKYLPKLVEEQ
jgi:hypothetical protein